MMTAMAKLGFVPSLPPTSLSSESDYDEDEDKRQQVVLAIKAYMTQNGSAFDTMRGAVGDAVDNAVTRKVETNDNPHLLREQCRKQN